MVAKQSAFSRVLFVLMALAGISHGGKNDTFNEVAAVEQKVQTAALCGAIKKPTVQKPWNESR